MPSTSKKQHNFMAAVAKNPAFAKKAGVPQSVGAEFLKADKGRKFREGGAMKESKAMVKKEIGFMKKAGAPKSMVKHEMAEAKGMRMGGKCYAEGGMTSGKVKKIADKEVKAHEKRMHHKKMAGGGLSAGHKSADGCAVKGKTKAKQVMMRMGGKACG